MAFAACKKDEDLGAPAINLSASEINLTCEGGDTIITLTATRDWTVTVDAEASEWLGIDPMSGTASNDAQTITLTYFSNDGYDRVAEVAFTIGMQTKYLSVKQAGVAGSTDALVVYSNDFDKTKAEKGDKWATYLDTFDGWLNAKGEGMAAATYSFNSMTARTNSGNGSAGKYSDYSGSGMNYLWFGSGTPYFAVKNLALAEGVVNYTLSFGTERYEYKEGVEVDNNFNWNEFKVYVSADAKKWVKLDFDFAGGALPVAKWDLASTTFTVPAGTTTLNVYFASSVGAAYAIDDVSLVQSAVAGTTVDFSTGEEFELSDSTVPGGDNTDGSVPESKGDKSVSEFLALADDANYYKLTGTVSGFNSQYCSFDLTDETGTVYVYSVLEESKSQWASKIQNNGTITILGKYYYYEKGSKHEVVDAYIVSYTSPSGEAVTPDAGGDNTGDTGTVGPVEGNHADFETLSASSSYGSATTTAGWKISNCAVQIYGTANTGDKFAFVPNDTKAVCLNGKTTAVGVIESPEIVGGCGKLSLSYAYPFNETNGVSFKIEVIAGDEVQTFNVENTTAAKLEVCTYSVDVNVAGNFKLKITNNSPSKNSSSNKDRYSIWNLTWTDCAE